MNTFEMKLWGWSGECHIHSIPQDLYDHLAVCEYDPDWYGYDDTEALYNLSDNNSDEIRLWDKLGKKADNFYWHEGDIFCGIRPTPSVFSIEVNDKELDLSKFGLDVPFPYKSECDMENSGINIVPRDDLVPTIGFCSNEKGYQGSYTIETSDKEFDIDKVEVDIVHTSFGSFIEGYYYDGKLMEQTGDPEGDPKGFEVNFGYSNQEKIDNYYGNDVSGRFVA